MPRLDVGTLAFCAATVSLLAGAVLAAFVSVRRPEGGKEGPWPGGSWFAACCLVYGGGLLLILDAAAGDTPTAPLLTGNLLVVLSALAARQGALALAGRPSGNFVVPALVLGVFVALEGWFLVVDDSVNARIAVVSLARILPFGEAAWILALAHRAETDPARRGWSGRPLVALVLAAWGVLLAIRSADVLGADPIADFLGLQGMQAAYFLCVILGEIGIAIALIRLDAADEAGRLTAMVRRQTEALHDQIERHAQARRLLRDQLALQDAMLDTLPGPLFAKAVSGEYLLCNTAFEQVVGRTRDRLVGQTAFDVIDPETAAAHAAADRRLIEGHGPQTYEAPIQHADGRVRRMLVCKSSYLDPDGAVAGIVGSLTDISELVRVTEDLRRSEADLRAILDNMTDLFFRTDRDGRFCMLSRSADTVLGWPADALLGRSAHDLFLDPGEHGALLAAITAGGDSVTDHEFQVRRHDGTTAWVAASARARRAADGTPGGTEGTLRLIEERKRAERSIQDGQELVQALLNCSSDATMLFEADGTLLACNRVLAERLGLPPDRMVGLPLDQLFPPAVAAKRVESIRRVLDKGEQETLVDRRDGMVLHNTVTPVRDAGGRPVRLAVFSRDITAQVEAEERLARHVAEIERSNADLEQFAYVASHDLREPLRMISAYLALIEKRYGDAFDADGHEFLGYARDGALRMDRLVLDLLDFSRTGRGTLPNGAVDLAPLVDRVISDQAPMIEDSGALVESTLEAEAPVVRGDPAQIGRVVQNLLANALKYRDADRPMVVRITARLSGAMWEVAVADTGIGIEAEHFERIFRIFQRLHTRDRFEGTGIGLAICKKIVERHGGRIWVESTPEAGSTFRFTLPAVEPAPDRG